MRPGRTTFALETAIYTFDVLPLAEEEGRGGAGLAPGVTSAPAPAAGAALSVVEVVLDEA